MAERLGIDTLLVDAGDIGAAVRAAGCSGALMPHLPDQMECQEAVPVRCAGLRSKPRSLRSKLPPAFPPATAAPAASSRCRSRICAAIALSAMSADALETHWHRREPQLPLACRQIAPPVTGWIDACRWCERASCTTRSLPASHPARWSPLLSAFLGKARHKRLVQHYRECYQLGGLEAGTRRSPTPVGRTIAFRPLSSSRQVTSHFR